MKVKESAKNNKRLLACIFIAIILLAGAMIYFLKFNNIPTTSTFYNSRDTQTPRSVVAEKNAQDKVSLIISNGYIAGGADQRLQTKKVNINKSDKTMHIEVNVYKNDIQSILPQNPKLRIDLGKKIPGGQYKVEVIFYTMEAMVRPDSQLVKRETLNSTITVN